jgi:hypothetical protein
MPDRWERIGKLVCGVLAALLMLQIGRMVFRRDALSRLTIPALPSLAPETNSPSANMAGPGGPPAIAGKGSTNSTKPATNFVAQGTKAIPGNSATNAPANPAQPMKAGRPASAVPGLAENDVRTNAVKAAKSGTNSLSNTNLAAAAGTNGTHNGKPAAMSKRGPGAVPPEAMAAMAMAMGGPGGPGGMPKPAELPIAVQARVFRITDSEILGQVMRPLPVALLGIVGDVAFIRSSAGQSGVVKEGESVGALKLVKIGTNRVLVEEDGQKKELMIFSGYGGESLMPKQKDTSQ